MKGDEGLSEMKDTFSLPGAATPGPPLFFSRGCRPWTPLLLLTSTYPETRTQLRSVLVVHEWPSMRIWMRSTQDILMFAAGASDQPPNVRARTVPGRGHPNPNPASGAATLRKWRGHAWPLARPRSAQRQKIAFPQKSPSPEKRKGTSGPLENEFLMLLEW